MEKLIFCFYHGFTVFHLLQSYVFKQSSLAWPPSAAKLLRVIGALLPFKKIKKIRVPYKSKNLFASRKNNSCISTVNIKNFQHLSFISFARTAFRTMVASVVAFSDESSQKFP
jgi:hypothetical protein